MNNTVPYKSRRQKYICGAIIGILALIIAAIIILDSSSSTILTILFQCLVPILCIVLAGILVSLPAKIVRSKFLLTTMFFLLLCLGIFVNAHIIFTQNYKPGLFETILIPFTTTLASFFPSRGDYNIEIIEDEWRPLYIVFHTLTYFYAAWLGFSLFGRKLLNRTALAFMPHRHKNLIWGYSEGAFELAKSMLRNTEREEPVFIIDDDIEFNVENDKRIFDMLSNEGIIAINTHYGNLSESPKDFQCGKFSWHHFKRMLTLGKYFGGHRHYFITENQDFNVKYALIVLRQLSFQSETLKEKTHLYIRSEQDSIDVFFQESLKQMGDKVEVHIYNQSDVTARQFVENHPILRLADYTNPSTGEKWLTVHHDALQVEGEINILMLGLGWTGYEMLKKQVCDAQYIGEYKVNVTIVDNDYKYFHGRYQYIIREAARFGVNICINPIVWLDDEQNIQEQSLNGEKCSNSTKLEKRQVHQANGHLFYKWLGYRDYKTQMVNILYFNRIIVALGSDELNVNTALQLTNFRNHYLTVKENRDTSLMPEHIYAHVRDKERYSYYDDNDNAPICIFGGLKSIYCAANFVDEKMDITAKLVNYVYSRSDIDLLSEDELRASLADGSADTYWAGCTIFDQDSSRAVALNIKNIIMLAGGLQRLSEIINIPLYIERLAEMEHKRWNAFHYMRGIGPWEIDEVYNSVDNKGRLKSNGKLFFNKTLVRHICLVDYEQLDAATRRVQILGNIHENFKASDQRIISHFPAFYSIKSL